jgi:hypothetical protein
LRNQCCRRGCTSRRNPPTPCPGPDGLIRIWLDRKFVDRLGHMRGPGESYSDVILRLVQTEGLVLIPAAAQTLCGPVGEHTLCVIMVSPMSKPQTDDLAGGQTFGAWVVARVDPSGKRALVVCACGTAREVGAAALLKGESVGCGCRATPRLSPDAFRPASKFSTELAALEGRSSSKWHRGGGRSA